MVNVKNKKKGDKIWVVVQKVEEMIYPLLAKFDSVENNLSDKIIFINIDNQKLCYPTHLVFETQEEAEICASILFVKMCNTMEPPFDTTVYKKTLARAREMVTEFEATYPDKCLYYWMSDDEIG
jgi:hypothetical protein